VIMFRDHCHAHPSANSRMAARIATVMDIFFIRTTELISGGPSALLYRWTLSAV